VRFSKDGQRVFAGCRDGTLLTVDCTAKKEASAVHAHDGGIFAMDLSQDQIITAGTDGFVRIWDATDCSKNCEWKAHESRVRDVLLLPCGTKVASASLDGEIRIWSLDGHMLHRLIGHSGPVVSLAISNDQQTIVSGGDDGQVLFWDAVTGDLQIRIAGHQDPVTDLIFTTKGEQLISSGLDGDVLLWGRNRRSMNASGEMKSPMN
jgi:WD40 repeat protein